MVGYDDLPVETRAAVQVRLAPGARLPVAGQDAVGVAMQDPLGNAVAISVPVPSQRFQDRQALITERLLATKRAMEKHMNAAAA